MGLNHIYKVIWSKTKNAWVVVSEIAKRDGKSSVKSVATSVASKGIAATVVAMILCGGITSAASFATPGATASGTDSVAVGDGVTATGEGSVAIGARTVAEKTTGNELYLQTGTGLKSSATGKKSLAIQGEATEENATAIQGVAKGQGAVAIGYSLSKGKRAVGLGWNSMALSDSSIAIGNGAMAQGEKSISIGTGNIVKAAKSSVIGDPSHLDTSATGTHVQGNDNGTAAAPIMAKDSTFMGNNNLAGTAGTEGIHVVGNNNNIQSSNVMVLGNGITAGTGYDGAVILGNASATSAYTAPTNTTINGVTLDASKYAGTTAAGSTLSQGSIVSVGDTGKERQIKNVAAGEVSATSTDAVTGSQLYGAVKALTESNSSPDVYVHVNDGTGVQKAGDATINAGKADEMGGATGNKSIAIGYKALAEQLYPLVMLAKNVKLKTLLLAKYPPHLQTL